MATITITTTAAMDARIVVAVGRRLRLGRDATGAEVKAFLVNDLVEVLRQYEAGVAADAAANAIVPIVPT